MSYVDETIERVVAQMSGRGKKMGKEIYSVGELAVQSDQIG